jgi:hypothetical protein
MHASAYMHATFPTHVTLHCLTVCSNPSFVINMKAWNFALSQECKAPAGTSICIELILKFVTLIKFDGG